MPKYTLVDWYGNRQTFDRDTIYAEGEDGGLVPFTQGAGNPVIEPLNVTQNGVYTTPVGVNGFGPVSVNVPDLPPVLQSKEATKNGEYTPDSGYDGLSKVTVNVPAPEIKLQEKTITENGEYTADAGFDGLLKVLVDVAGSANIVIKYGVFGKSDNGSKTVTNRLGVMPDMVMMFPIDYPIGGSLSGDGIVACISCNSNQFLNSRYAYSVKKSGSTITAIDFTGNVLADTNNSNCITATETTITFPPRPSGLEYHYIAFSGLT